jgi:hypothetical protein
MESWYYATLFSSMCTGLVLAIIRMREPMFKRQLKVLWYTYWGELPPDTDKLTYMQEKSQVEGTLLSFLMSSLNIELVHIILHAVSMKTVGTAKHESDYRVYHDYDHLSKNEFVMDSIEIEDRDKWDISQVTQDMSIRRLSSSLKGGMEGQVQRKLIINEDIRVIEYSPDVFAFLRQRDGFNNDILRDSLDPEVNKSSVFRAGEGSGKSGSFFFFSADANFIIKTMTRSDFKAFQRIQKAYFTRVCNDEHSLLARIYGIYSVIMEDKEPVTLVVMGNTMKKAERHLGVFDLKGSMVKRQVKGPITSKKTTLKDVNLLNMNREKLWLNFKEADRKRILRSMRSDVEMLRKFNLMDYSLLLCIQENPNYEEAVKQKISEN